MTDPDLLVRTKVRGANRYADAVHPPHKLPQDQTHTTTKRINSQYPAPPYSIEAEQNQGHFVNASWAAIYRLIAKELRRTWHIADTILAQQIVWQIERAQNQDLLIDAVLRLLKQNKAVPKIEKTPEERDADSLLAAVYQNSPEEASSDDILKVIQGMFGWLSRDEFETIDYCFRIAEISKLAPELLIAMLRATGRYRERISGWDTFSVSVASRLKQLGLDSEDLLQGL